MATILVHRNGGRPKIWAKLSTGEVFFGTLTSIGALQSRGSSKTSAQDQLAEGYLSTTPMADNNALEFLNNSSSFQNSELIRNLCTSINSQVGTTVRVAHVMQKLAPSPPSAPPQLKAASAKLKKTSGLLKNWKKPSSDEPYAW